MDIVPVSGHLGAEDRIWTFFLAKRHKAKLVCAVHNNLQGDVKEPLNSHIREFLKEDSSLSMGQGRSNTYQILRRNFYP